MGILTNAKNFLEKKTVAVAKKAADGIAATSALSPKQIEAVDEKRRNYLAQKPDMESADVQKTIQNNLGAIGVEVYQDYLRLLKKIYAPMDTAIENFDALNRIRYFDITKWVTDSEEQNLDRLVNVYQVLSKEECNIALIYHRTMEKCEVTLGVVSTDPDQADPSRVMMYDERLKMAIRGNFPGVEIHGNQGKKDPFGLGIPQTLRACVGEKTAQSVAIVSNLASEKSKDFISQSMDKLLDGIIPQNEKEEYNAKKGIFTQGVLSSPLQNLMCIEGGSRVKYLKSFKGETSRTHYRRVFSPDEGRGMTLSSALTTLGMIFDNLNIPDEQENPIAEVAVELVGNALEHTRSDCVLDVDIADNYVKRKEPDGKKYYGANICVLNFSPTLLSSQLKEKMCYNPQISSEGDDYRYWRLKKAYLSQKKFFNENYADEEFFMLSAFQDKISGRPNEYLTGGTGLPTLIKSLELQAEDDNCYVLSGDRKMRFIRRFLEYDKERWLGMNRQCDFMNCIPDPSVFTHSPIYFPGTAYNLNFVIARET